MMHGNVEFNLGFSYFLFFEVDDGNCFFKAVDHVIDDESLWCNENPADLLVV